MEGSRGRLKARGAGVKALFFHFPEMLPQTSVADACITHVLWLDANRHCSLTSGEPAFCALPRQDMGGPLMLVKSTTRATPLREPAC